MPKDKKKRQVSSDSDSGPEDRGPPQKKPATTSAATSKPANDEEYALDLGRKRTVKINEFKGKRYVDIREYYMDKSTSDMRPGKKGITLYLDEFNRLVEAADDIRKALRNG